MNLQNSLTISCDKTFKVAAEKLGEYFSLLYGVRLENIEADGDIAFVKTNCASEHFSLEIKDEKAVICAGDLKGALYGASTLLQLVDRETLSAPEVHMEDGPYKAIRGVHTYLPSRQNIEVYKRILDVISFFKMNTVIIEVGAGMEYEKHPEINSTWEMFCDLCMNKFPGVGQSRSLQGSDVYWKDSIHTEHAGGSYLTKGEVSDIVEYAKSLGLNVVPEIQALSHCYYLTLAHREIAEREDDIFPDTYCPLNEKSYELYFEVATEVLEVFKPTHVSVGHDEIRILGVCEKCREKTGHELLAYELNRLHAFYAKHGIRIMMWGEKMQHYRNFKGVMMGEPKEMITPFGDYYRLPATYEAKYAVPKDILMLDWHYSLSHQSEKDFEDDGFNSAYGNFYGSKFVNWKKRTAGDNLLGAEVSTWCTTDEETFAHDGIFFEVMFSAHMLWDRTYDDEKYDALAETVMREMVITRALIRRDLPDTLRETQTTVVYKAEKEKAVAALDINKATVMSDSIKKLAAAYGDTMYGVPIDTVSVWVKNEFYADSLVFFHSAKEDMPFKPSHWFADESRLGFGTYAVLYEDGKIELANIVYGKTIGALDFDFKFGGVAEEVSFEIDDATGENTQSAVAPTFAHKSPWAGSIVYGTIPMLGEGTAVFAYEWKNPHPDKKIVKINAINTCHIENQGTVLFGITAVELKK